MWVAERSSRERRKIGNKLSIWENVGKFRALSLHKVREAAERRSQDFEDGDGHGGKGKDEV